MSQSIGNHTYQIYAKNSSGVYSSPISLNVSVTSCVGVDGFYGISNSSSVGPRISKYSTNSTAVLFETTLNQNTFRQALGGAISSLTNKIYVPLWGGGISDPNAKIVTVDNTTGQVLSSFDVAPTTTSNLVILPNDDIAIAVKNSSTGFWEIKIYSNNGTLKTTIAPNSGINIQSNTKIVLDNTGTKLYMAVSLGGGVQAFDLTSSTVLWTKKPSSLSDVYNTDDIDVTSISPNRLFITSNRYSLTKSTIELDPATGNVLNETPSVNSIVLGSLDISPDSQSIVGISGNETLGYLTVSKKGLGTDTLVSVPVSQVGVPIIAVRVSKNSQEIYVSYNVQNQTETKDSVRVYSSLTGTLLRSYKNQLSFAVSNFII